jgi:hypothetical protein
MKPYQLMNFALQDLIKMIGAGEVQLPEFQRSFNWARSSRMELLDSIQRDYPVGTLLLLEVPDRGSPFGSRTFEQTDFERTDQEPPKPKYLVLDGQQRLSTCFWALRAPESANDRVLALQLRSLFDATGGKPGVPVDFSEMLVMKRTGDNAAQMLYSQHLLPLPFLTDGVALGERLHDYREQLAKDATSAEYSTFVSKYARTYVEIFLTYEFPAVLLPTTLDLEAVCVVFTKLNSTGLRLSAFDLCVATMFPHKIPLRDWLKSAHKNAAVRAVDSDGTNILQTVALLAGVSPKKAGLPKDLHHTHASKHWVDAIKGLAEAAGMLADLGMPRRAAVPYDALVPALGAVLTDVPYENAPAKQKETTSKAVARWVYQTALAKRYNEGTDVKQQADYAAIRDWVTRGALPQFLTEPVIWSESMKRTGRSGARSRALVAAMNDLRPKDFMSGQFVGRGEGRVLSDLHHIFPRAYLKDRYQSAVESNLALNLTFLTPTTNIFMSDDAPSVYLGKMIDRRTSEQKIARASAVQQIKAVLAIHLIDETGFEAMMADDYEAFLESRAEAMRVHLESSYGVPIIEPPSVEEDEEEDVGIEETLDADEEEAI